MSIKYIFVKIFFQLINILSLSAIPIFFLIFKPEQYSNNFIFFGIASSISAGIESFHQNYFLKLNKKTICKKSELPYEVFLRNIFFIFPIIIVLNFFHTEALRLFLIVVFLVFMGQIRYIYSNASLEILCGRLILFLLFLYDGLSVSIYPAAVLFCIYHFYINFKINKLFFTKKTLKTHLEYVYKIFGKSVFLILTERVKDILPALIYLMTNSNIMHASLLAMERIAKSLSGLAVGSIFTILINHNIKINFYFLLLIVLIFNCFGFFYHQNPFFYFLPFCISGIISIDLIKNIGFKSVIFSHLLSMIFFAVLFFFIPVISYAVIIEHIVCIFMIIFGLSYRLRGY